MASVGHTSAAPSSGWRIFGPDPPVGHADHPVERDGPIEPAGRRRLEHLHAAHAEPHDRDLAHVVVHDEEVGRDLEVAELEVVVELLHVTHARGRIRGRHHVDRRTRERLGGAHREPVRGETTAEVVEERPQSHDVGMQDETAFREAVGSGVDRVDERAVDALQRDVLDIDFVGAGFEFGQLLLR